MRKYKIKDQFKERYKEIKKVEVEGKIYILKEESSDGLTVISENNKLIYFPFNQIEEL